jgi:hypothetical protein
MKACRMYWQEMPLMLKSIKKKNSKIGSGV